MSDVLPRTSTAAIFDAIERNQELWRRTRSPRKRYQLCLKNDELFKLIGVEFEPMTEPRGIYGWWLRRGLRAGHHRCSSCGRRHAVEYLTPSGVVCGDCVGRSARSEA